VKVIDKSKGTRKNIDIVDVVKQAFSSPNQQIREGGKSSSQTTGPKGGSAKASERARASSKTSSGATSSLGVGRPPATPTGGH